MTTKQNTRETNIDDTVTVKFDHDTQEHYRDEYREVSSNLRHYSNLRFTVLTVFLAFQAALIGFGLDSKSPILSTFMAKIAGLTALLTATFVFWTYIERVHAYRMLFLKRALELETKLEFHQYLSRPIPRYSLLSTHLAGRIFFLTVAVFWIVIFWVSLEMN